MNMDMDIKVLLVDDEEAFRQALARRLGRKGMEIGQASSGEMALERLAQAPVDVVVMDVKMPGMGGLEALRRIRQAHPGTEVILLTGHAAMDDGIEGIRNGAFDYLQKPVENENLLHKINQAAEKRIRQREKAQESQMRAAMEKQMATAERLASLGTLAAGVAHEINNPLAIISESAGVLRLLMDKKEMASMPFRDNFLKAVGMIEKSVNRARRTTMQLLGFAGQPDTVFREVDLEEMVDEVILLVNGQARAKGVVAAQERNPEPIVLWTDPHRLRQVLINLASNGIAACERGGRVTLGTKLEKEQAKVWVRDNGKGVPKENLDRIFEPFFTTKPPGEGTGLGLFVSLDMMERLGGKIEVESKTGAGSCFTVSIPLLCRLHTEKNNDIDWREKARELERRDDHG